MGGWIGRWVVEWVGSGCGVQTHAVRAQIALRGVRSSWDISARNFLCDSEWNKQNRAGRVGVGWVISTTSRHPRTASSIPDRQRNQ